MYSAPAISLLSVTLISTSLIIIIIIIIVTSPSFFSFFFLLSYNSHHETNAHPHKIQKKNKNNNSDVKNMTRNSKINYVRQINILVSK